MVQPELTYYWGEIVNYYKLFFHCIVKLNIGIDKTRNFILRHVPKTNSHLCLPKDIYQNFQSSTICNRQKLESSPVSPECRMGHFVVVQPYNARLYSNKNKGFTTVLNNMDEPQNHGNSKTQKSTYYMTLSVLSSRTSKTSLCFRVNTVVMLRRGSDLTEHEKDGFSVSDI